MIVRCEGDSRSSFRIEFEIANFDCLCRRKMEILSDSLRDAVSLGGTARATIVLMAGVVMLGVFVKVSMGLGSRCRVIAAFL